VRATFTAQQGTGTRTEGRPCEFTFTKVQAPDAGITTVAQVRRFDGVWVANWVCESAPAGLPRLTGRFVATAKDGVLHAETGPKGLPGGVTYDGIIEPNGVVTINVNGLSGIPDPYNRPAGTKIGHKMLGVSKAGAERRPDRIGTAM
jgi:hypothetical protein